MKLNTHLEIDNKLSGKVIKLLKGYSKVELKTSKTLTADKEGLIHGGFTFSAADFAAMAAINEPNVVLTAADVKFLAPVKLGDTILFEAKVFESNGKKSKVEVIATVENREVFKGIFKTYTLDKHILTV